MCDAFKAERVDQVFLYRKVTDLKVRSEYHTCSRTNETGKSMTRVSQHVCIQRHHNPFITDTHL